MKLLMVINKDKFNRYQFINIEDKTKIDLVLELYTDKGSFLLNEKDAIFINEKLLNKKSTNYVEPYSFELTQDVEPKEVFNLNIEENIILVRDNKKYVFKRIYG